jgi:predicted CXXCH cytochrome family protein
MCGRRVRVLAGLLLLGALPASGGVEHTRHNFSVGKPETPAPPKTGARGAAVAAQEMVGVCVFCHTPHNANPLAGLWNHKLPAVTYRLYESSTLQARVTQPTGASRLCLSCHDGTLALGDLRVPPRGSRVVMRRLEGSAKLGTDLSDDHPISFVYDVGLAVRTGQLVDPSSLPPQVRLDSTGQLQCTSCHDGHEDRYADFLVMDNRGSRLCTTCHRIDGWPESAHATSSATQTRGGSNPWPHTPYISVADNGCGNCHRQHAAAHPEWLLLQRVTSDLCFACHDGSVAAKDVRRAFRTLSFHPVEATEGLHQPNEDPLFMKRHVACDDCHDPHSVREGVRAQARVAPRAALGRMEIFGGVSGVDRAGGRIRQARTEYEVCYKCHGIQEQAGPLLPHIFLLTRQDDETNIRLEFNTNNMSFHPVEAIGRDQSIQGLEAGFTASSMLTCTDCHNSEESRAGNLPRGPHGSVYEPILAREYQIGDPSMESFQSYALCYRCHNRSALLSGGAFPHRTHVVDQQTSCVVCHDAHGSRQSPFLVNFLLRGKAGNEVVKASSSGKLEFRSSGRDRGTCFLTCHGSNHDPKEYPVAQTVPSGMRLRDSVTRPSNEMGRNPFPAGRRPQ